MSSKLFELVTASQTCLQTCDEAVSSLEYTHNWEMDLRDHSVQHASWGHGTYLYGLHYYVVNTMGYDTTYSWQSGIVSSKIFLGDGDDKVYGNIGSDTVHTGKGDDLLYGEAGNDLLRGGRDDDELYGGLGNDVLKGEKGNDILDGGDGRDILIGSSGDDIFVVTQASSTDNADVIRDFGNGKDRVDFGNNVSTVYVCQINGHTIFQNSDAADAEVYAALKGYTGTLDNIESTYDAPHDFTFVDIL